MLNARVFSYPTVGVTFENNILSSSHKLKNAEHAGTLKSCSGTKNEQKNTHNNVIEVEIKALYI